MRHAFRGLAHCEADKDKESELILRPWHWVKKASVSKRKVINTRCTQSQLCTKYPSVLPVTSWYLHAMWTYRSREERDGGDEREWGGFEGEG